MDYGAIARIIYSNFGPAKSWSEIHMMNDLADYLAQEDHNDRHGSGCTCIGNTWPNQFNRKQFIRQCYGEEE